MIFSDKLRLYNAIKTKFSSNSNYLFIMRHLSALLDEDDKQMTGKTSQEIKLSTENYAVQIAGTDPATGEYRSELHIDDLREDVEAEDFEW